MAAETSLASMEVEVGVRDAHHRMDSASSASSVDMSAWMMSSSLSTPWARWVAETEVAQYRDGRNGSEGRTARIAYPRSARSRKMGRMLSGRVEKCCMIGIRD